MTILLFMNLKSPFSPFDTVDPAHPAELNLTSLSKVSPEYSESEII